MPVLGRFGAVKKEPLPKIGLGTQFQKNRKPGWKTGNRPGKKLFWGTKGAGIPVNTSLQMKKRRPKKEGDGARASGGGKKHYHKIGKKRVILLCGRRRERMGARGRSPFWGKGHIQTEKGTNRPSSGGQTK